MPKRHWRHRDTLDKLRDYIIPLTTPFAEDLSVDLEGLAANAESALRIPGCGGIYLGSVYQEFWTLTSVERMKALEIVGETVANRCPIIVGVSSASTKTSLTLADHARACKADMLMAWPPIFGPRDNDGVFRFYEQLCESTDMPICVYSTKLSELGFYMDPVLLARIAELDNICAVKEASFDLTTFLFLLRNLGDQIAVSTPFEEYWLAGRALLPDQSPEFLMGSSRALYMQTEQEPVLQRFLSLARQDRIHEAFEVLASIETLIEGMQMASFKKDGGHPIAAVKYAISLLGMRGGPVRPPTPSLTVRQQVHVRMLLEGARLLSSDADPSGASVANYAMKEARRS